MRRSLLLLWILLSVPLWGQDYIHQDYYGQGASREQALQKLLAQIGQVVSFENPALLATYRADIERQSVESIRQGGIQLSLSGTVLDGIFQARQNRAAGIVDEGARAKDDAVRKTYYNWAWYYLSSLPEGHQLPGKDRILKWLLSHRQTPSASLAVPMTHIEREVAAIRAIVGAWDAPVKNTPGSAVKEKPVQTETLVETAPESRTPVSAVTAAEQKEMLPASAVGGNLQGSRHQAARETTARSFPNAGMLFTAGLAPELVFGTKLFLKKDKWGGLLSFQSNFQGEKALYPARSDGSRPDGGFIWPEGSANVGQLSICVGACYAFLPWLNAYATGGYGYRQVYWKDGDGQWALMEDLLARGFAMDAGLLFMRNHLALSIGLTTVSFQTLGLSVGAGFFF